MALEDRLNPNDGSRIDRFDSFMLGLHRRAAEYWTAKTGRSRKELSRALYSVGIAASGIGALTGYKIFENVIFMAGSVSLLANNPQMSNLEEEITAETFDMPKKSGKYIRAVTYGGAALNMLYAAVYFTKWLSSGNPDSLKEFVGTVSSAIALSAITSAYYVAKTEAGPPEPPGKPKIRKWLEQKLGELGREFYPHKPATMPVSAGIEYR